MTTLDLSRLSANLAAAGLPAAVLSGAMPAVRRIALAGVLEHFSRSMGPDGRPWAPLSRERHSGGSRPLVDTARLLGSVEATTEGTSVTLSASAPGAAVHQFGATIRPRLARLLAIPLTEEARKSGSPRTGFGRPLFAIRAKSGNRFLAESSRDGPSRRPVLHYLLREKVVIPARPYLGFGRRTVGRIEAEVATRAQDWIGSAIAGGSISIT